MKHRLGLSIIGIICLCLPSDTNAYWCPLDRVVADLERLATNQWRVNFRAFDPDANAWISNSTGLFNAQSVTISTNAGIVVWSEVLESASPAYRINYTAYDPALQRWQTTNSETSPFYPYGYTVGGIVTWNQGGPLVGWTVAASTYDPELRQWLTIIYPRVGGDRIYNNAHGDAHSWLEVCGTTWTAHFSIYDPLRHEWRSSSYGPVVSSTGMIGNDNGTVTVYGNGRHPAVLGYDYITGAWDFGMTRPLASFSMSATRGNPPLRVWFTDMSIGCSNWTWSFGDGTPTSPMRSLSHSFFASGTNTVSFTGRNSSGENTANRTVVLIDSPRLEARASPGQQLEIVVTSKTESVLSVETSTDLSTWSQTTVVTNNTGRLPIVVGIETNIPSRFFRVREIEP